MGQELQGSRTPQSPLCVGERVSPELPGPGRGGGPFPGAGGRSPHGRPFPPAPGAGPLAWPAGTEADTAFPMLPWRTSGRTVGYHYSKSSQDPNRLRVRPQVSAGRAPSHCPAARLPCPGPGLSSAWEPSCHLPRTPHQLLSMDGAGLPVIPVPPAHGLCHSVVGGRRRWAL